MRLVEMAAMRATISTDSCTAHLLPRLDGEGDSTQGRREVRCVLHDNTIERDGSRPGPALRQLAAILGNLQLQRVLTWAAWRSGKWSTWLGQRVRKGTPMQMAGFHRDSEGPTHKV